jgi:hypothetical protein
MKKQKIFHTVNSGLCFSNAEESLLIDVFHNGKRLGFSPTPEKLIRQMKKHEGMFATAPDLAFTHLHEDHYDPELVRQFLREYPGARIYAPGFAVKGLRLRELPDGSEEINFGSFTVTSFPTVHDGPQYISQPHRSLWLSSPAGQYLLCGDAYLDGKLADNLEKQGKLRPKAVFVNLYQLGEPNGKAFLKRICPQKVFIYHLPMEEDDVYNYRRLAGEMLSGKEGFSVEMLKPMHRVV